MPVSSTVILTNPGSFCSRNWMGLEMISALMDMSPWWVNLREFPTRLNKICSSLWSSE